MNKNKLDKKNVWIKAGYELFALNSLESLKIESLSKKIGINKSSFYHFFVDIEIFVTHLLAYHIEQSKIIAYKEINAKVIDPELIEILIEHKLDLLFNKQLRISRFKSVYDIIIEKSDTIIGSSFINLWEKEMNLKLSKKQIESLYELAIENFYLQINHENLNNIWLTDYFKNLKRISSHFIN